MGRRPNKRLSQSFLEDQNIAAAIVRSAEIAPDEAVLEVGPGLGVLTHRLAQLTARLVAVEVDPHLAQTLREGLADAPQVEIVTADILTFTPTAHFGSDFVVVANLPYHITSPALRHLLAVGPPFATRLIVMVQAEVAERIAAQPPQMSALSVITQAQTRVRIARRVPRTAFFPAPKVDSAVLALDVLGPDERSVARDEIDAFSGLVHAGFAQPRKTLANSLADGLRVRKSVAAELLAAANLAPDQRPQSLNVDDWARLFRTTDQQLWR